METLSYDKIEKITDMQINMDMLIEAIANHGGPMNALDILKSHDLLNNDKMKLITQPKMIDESIWVIFLAGRLIPIIEPVKNSNHCILDLPNTFRGYNNGSVNVETLSKYARSIDRARFGMNKNSDIYKIYSAVFVALCTLVRFKEQRKGESISKFLCNAMERIMQASSDPLKEQQGQMVMLIELLENYD